MPAANKILTIAIGIHLSLVALFTWTDLGEKHSGPFFSALRTYKNLSGCFRDYTFFAPHVASDLRAGFYLHEDNGKVQFVEFVSENREIAFRYNCIVASCMRDEGARDLFARSWAAIMLGAHPRANTVNVVTEAYKVPGMKAYRQGERPRWEVVYAGEFSRK